MEAFDESNPIMPTLCKACSTLVRVRVRLRLTSRLRLTVRNRFRVRAKVGSCVSEPSFSPHTSHTPSTVRGEQDVLPLCVPAILEGEGGPLPCMLRRALLRGGTNHVQQFHRALHATIIRLYNILSGPLWLSLAVCTSRPAVSLIEYSNSDKQCRCCPQGTTGPIHYPCWSAGAKRQ